MKKFKIPFKVFAWVMVEVEAEDIDQAIEIAEEDAHISSFVGNGGSDKLIGVYGDNISIEVLDQLELIESDIEELKQ